MRQLGSATLTMLTAIELFIAPLLDGSAMAANPHAKTKPQQVAQSCWTDRNVPQGQVIGQVLSLPWFIDPRHPPVINGYPLCIDPHPYSWHYIPGGHGATEIDD